MNPLQSLKRRIRHRDRKKMSRDKLHVCSLCSAIGWTETHHLFYSEKYDKSSLLEVCSDCHAAIHEL